MVLTDVLEMYAGGDGHHWLVSYVTDANSYLSKS